MPHHHTQKKEQQHRDDLSHLLQLRSWLVFVKVGRDPWKAGESEADPVRSKKG